MSLETKIFDTLGIEDNNREKSAHLIPQYKELANKFPKATIWLKGDEPYYDGLGVVVGESEDLVAVEKEKEMVTENKKIKRLQSVREARKLQEQLDDNDWSKLKPLTEKEANLVIEQAVKSGTTIEDIQIHQEGKTTYLVVPIYEFDDDGYDSWIKFIRSTSIEHQYGHDSEWFVIPRGFKIKRSSAGKTIYKATIGFIIEIEIDGTKKKAYVGENSGEGVIYKDYKAFESSEGICYIPEYGFRNESEFDHQRYGDLENKLIGFEEDGYTRNMLEKIVEEHNKETGDTLSSESLFEILLWAFPETYLDDREIDDGLDESLGNKKIYNSSDYFSFSNPEGASIFETEYSQFDGEYYPEDCFEVILDESAIDLRLNDVITIDLKDYGTIQAKVLLIDPNSDNILVAVIN